MASTRECPSCAIEIDADSDICPYCGYDLPRERTGVKWVAALLIILMIFYLVL
jgi:RNA polymerase subunit RPABC4/transcription elongation factor Spt4